MNDSVHMGLLCHMSYPSNLMPSVTFGCEILAPRLEYEGRMDVLSAANLPCLWVLFGKNIWDCHFHAASTQVPLGGQFDKNFKISSGKCAKWPNV